MYGVVLGFYFGKVRLRCSRGLHSDRFTVGVFEGKHLDPEATPPYPPTNDEVIRGGC